MKKNFKLTKESKINSAGKILFRIQATVSFRLITKGTKGGWVESEGNVYGNAWVSGDAEVYGNAWVSGDAEVYGNAWVSGNAEVYGNARVSGNAEVYGNARVSGNAEVYGNARVSGNAWEKSPLQIQGTYHFVNICKKGFLKIGCFEFTFKEWKKEFVRIGKENGYTPTQIKEYGAYIDLAIKLNPAPKKKLTKKTSKS